MLFENMWQRIALDTDRMMITQCGNDYHDYSDNRLPVSISNGRRSIVLNACRLKQTRVEFTSTFTSVSLNVNRKSGRSGTKCVIPIPNMHLQ